MSQYRDPENPSEWQEAVDSAQVMLAIDSARAYGLITINFPINCGRAQSLLDRGAALGIHPHPQVIERSLAGIGASTNGVGKLKIK